jgi:hypothetical protein
MGNDMNALTIYQPALQPVALPVALPATIDTEPVLGPLGVDLIAEAGRALGKARRFVARCLIGTARVAVQTAVALDPAAVAEMLPGRSAAGLDMIDVTPQPVPALPPPPVADIVTVTGTPHAEHVGSGKLAWRAIGADGLPLMQGTPGRKGYRERRYATEEAALAAAAGLKPKRPRKGKHAG